MLANQLQAFYLEYVNNYITVDCIAEHNGLSKEHADKLIEMGRTIHEIRVDAWNYCHKQVEA